MRLSSFAGSDVGRTRSGNEDSYFCGRTVFAVADGLGGHQGGEVASAAAVAPLAALDGREFADPAEAAEALAGGPGGELGHPRPGRRRPGPVGHGHHLTAAAVAGDRHLQLAHVGDSRAYLLRDGSLEQLTTDHTVVGELVRRGRLTPDQAAVHPERSILTRAVGLDPRIPVDTPDPWSSPPATRSSSAPTASPRSSPTSRSPSSWPPARRRRDLPFPDRRRQLRRRPRQHHGGPAPGGVAGEPCLRPAGGR